MLFDITNEDLENTYQQVKNELERYSGKLLKKKVIIVLNKTEIFRKLPPLIKGYIRTGSWVCSGAIYDKVFDTFDVCIILKVSNLEEKYSRLARN